MRNYEYKRVNVLCDASEILVKMDELRKKGWKGLRYCPNNRDCDCSSDEIEGYRPLTASEARVFDRWVIKEKEKEIKELKKRASKHGFRLVKVN